MTTAAPYRTNVGNLVQPGDYDVPSPVSAWSGAATRVHVRTDIRDGLIWQTGADHGTWPHTKERVLANGVWSDWAVVGAVVMPAVQTATPTLTSITPTSVDDDAASHDITLTGTGFERGAVVYVDNVASANGATTYTNSTTLVRAIATNHASIVAAESVSVFVQNPDGKQSNAVVVAIATP